MSFGAAAPRRRVLPGEAPCPCGGGAYGDCCGPILSGEPAPTAERLMRSRFTAFALGDARHLLDTWHPTTAPPRLDLDDGVVWEVLQVVRTEAGQPDDRRGVVEFRAHWRDTATGERGERGDLHEVSRFRRAAGRWFYVDGDVGEPAD